MPKKAETGLTICRKQIYLTLRREEMFGQDSRRRFGLGKENVDKERNWGRVIVRLLSWFMIHFEETAIDIAIAIYTSQLPLPSWKSKCPLGIKLICWLYVTKNLKPCPSHKLHCFLDNLEILSSIAEWTFCAKLLCKMSKSNYQTLSSIIAWHSLLVLARSGI